MDPDTHHESSQDSSEGSHHHKVEAFTTASSMWGKSGQRILAVVFIVLFAGIGTALLISSHAAASYGPITGIGGKCLDNYGQVKADDNKIDLWACNSTVAQQWQYQESSSGSGPIVNVNGYCLDDYGAATAVGSLVDLYQCNGTVAQVWQVNTSTGTIVNPHSGLCLDDQYANTTNGNQIWIYTCNGTNAQKWDVSQISLPPTTPTTVAPSITSVSSTTFTAGTAGSFTVTDSGTPIPTLSESGTLPAGISFNATSGILSGTASSTGIYDISFTASNGTSPNATQSFSLSVVSAPTTGGTTSSSGFPFPDSMFDSGQVQSWPLNSSSASFVSDFVSDYKNNYGSVGVNSMPIYSIAANTPFSTMSVTSGCNNFLSNTGTQIPIPSYAQSNGSSDNPLAIYQASTNTLWEFWQAHSTSSTTWSACWGGKISPVTTSSGVFTAPYGLSATGISYAATEITEADVKSGSINHAINVILPPNCNIYIYPADRGDCSSHAGQPSEGTYFRFPSSVNCTNQANPFSDMVCAAIQKYGMVVIDQGGAVMLNAEQPSDWAAEGNTGTDPITASWKGAQEYQVVANLPWSQLQVVNPPNPYSP
jgi:hypothetical protein